jgi:YidC/Oxa1 family membrane protein insertase
MDRNRVLSWVVIAAALLLFWKFGMPLVSGNKDKGQQVTTELYANAPGFVPDDLDPPVTPGQLNKPDEGELCTLKGNRYEATLSSRGAALTHFILRDAQYATGVNGFDLSTTPDKERWRSLRTLFRGPDANDQLKYDRFPWKLEKLDGEKGCKFTFEDADVKIVKTVTAGTRPFEMNVETSITNLADAPKKHELVIGTYSYRTNADIKGSLGRVSPFQTELSCAAGKDVVRKNKEEFKSGWFAVPGTDRYAAVNTHYFTQALVPEPGEGAVAEPPRCELLAEEWARAAGQSPSDEDAAAVYHAKLVYPAKELAPKATATYRQIAFFGPKERDVLAQAAGGHPKLGDVINLGFFTPVARVLVGVLIFFHDHVTFGNWGLRVILFPLTLKSIKSTIAMRRLKPEVDALNEKFADDAQAKNLAMMELWKKHGVNPFGGCLPQLVQMPVWFAMYTTLQTAVEMYHTKFLWFTDMSAPDRFYVLPLVLGALMIVQQRIVPQQGMDPVQAKMMMYIMPAVFTVMMLFLPAALGVYMLTNSVLQIGQQLVLEQIAPRSEKGEIVVKQKGEGLGKDKARV